MSRRRKRSTKEKARDWERQDSGSADRRELHRLRRQLEESRKLERRALDQLEHAEERADLALAISDARRKPVTIKPRVRSPKVREATAVAISSDLHVEEDVDPRTVNGRNEFTPTIARARFERFVQGVVWLVQLCTTSEHRYQIRDLVWAWLGDFFSGYIHEELVEANHLSPVEAILFLQDMLGWGLDFLLAETDLELITIPCNYGNHGRTTAKRRIQTGAKNSYEWLLYHSMAQRYANEERVRFVIADGAHLYLDVYGYTIRTTHGDDVRYWGGVGGLSIPLRKAITGWDSFKPADCTLLGHFHQFGSHGDWAHVNGSLIGYNAFALSIKARYEPPRQSFFLIDKRRGKVLTTPVWVAEQSK